jgi:hypothetical protein
VWNLKAQWFASSVISWLAEQQVQDGGLLRLLRLRLPV